MPPIRQAPVATATSPWQDSADMLANLIDAAKRMQAKRLRRIVADMRKQAGDSSPMQSQNAQVGTVSDDATGKAPPAALAANIHTGINGRDERGRTALHFTCGMASSECATILLEGGAYPNASDQDGFSPLHMAAGYGRGQCIALLLSHGANPFLRDKIGRTARQLAVEINNGTVRGQDGSLVPRGDMDATIALLANAEWKEHLASQEKLRTSNGVPDSVLTDNTTAPYEELINLAGLGNLTAVSSALELFPDTADPLWRSSRAATLGNALSAACRNGHLEVAELLLKSGASVDAHDSDGATPLLAAADSGFSRPNVLENPWPILSVAAESGFADCVKLLLDAGAEPDAKDRVGVTALIAAAYNGHAECIQVLLASGAAVDARSHGGVTPLIAAAEGQHAQCIKLLLEAGADVDAKTSEGKTSLMHAVGRNAAEATKALIEGGANVNAVDADGCSALHHGARSDSSDCIDVLCNNGADLTRRCRKGKTAYMEALKGTESASVLEARWIALEEEVARRQAELLSLFNEPIKGPGPPVAQIGCHKHKDKRKEKKQKGCARTGCKKAEGRQSSDEEPQSERVSRSLSLSSSSSSAVSVVTTLEAITDNDDIFEIMAAETLRKSSNAQVLSDTDVECKVEAGKHDHSVSIGLDDSNSSAVEYHDGVITSSVLQGEEGNEWIRVDTRSNARALHKPVESSKRREHTVNEPVTKDSSQFRGPQIGSTRTETWKKKKNVGNKQQKSQDTVSSDGERPESGGKSCSSWLRAVLHSDDAQVAEKHVEASTDDRDQQPHDNGSPDKVQVLVVSSSISIGETEFKSCDLEPDTLSPTERMPDKMVGPTDVDIDGKVKELTLALQAEQELLLEERNKMQALEAALEQEKARAEKALEEVSRLREALTAQEVARLEVERERAHLEKQLAKHKSMVLLEACRKEASGVSLRLDEERMGPPPSPYGWSGWDANSSPADSPVSKEMLPHHWLPNTSMGDHNNFERIDNENRWEESAATSGLTKSASMVHRGMRSFGGFQRGSHSCLSQPCSIKCEKMQAALNFCRRCDSVNQHPPETCESLTSGCLACVPLESLRFMDLRRDSQPGSAYVVEKSRAQRSRPRIRGQGFGLGRKTDSFPNLQLLESESDALELRRTENDNRPAEFPVQSALKKQSLGGMSRSASEGCLSLLGLGDGKLPFAPRPGQKSYRDEGWFSLVPSPLGEEEIAITLKSSVQAR